MELIERVILRLSKKDHDRLKEVAQKHRTTVSKYVRQLITTAIWTKR